MKILFSKILLLIVFIKSLSFCSSQKNHQITMDNKDTIDITNYLPKNFVTDATVDYTNALQKAFDENRNILMPDFPILVNKNGIKIKSNSKVYFQENSKILLKPTESGSYGLLYIVDVKNVEVYKPVLIGDRFNHLGKSGEWGMGIRIIKSEKILIDSAQISECWGDGIYVGGGDFPNKNIKINNSEISQCRRNGISITNVDSLIVKSTKISDIYGTPPMAGICVEPNSKENRVNNIFLEDIQTENIEHFGIVIALNRNVGSTEEVKIYIDHHIDNNSTSGICFAGFKEKKLGEDQLKGEIIIKNSTWNNNQKPINISNFTLAPKTYIKNTKIVKNEIEKLMNKEDFGLKNTNIIIE